VIGLNRDVVVLRIGHRPQRDQRVTTHVGLTARALGANGMFLAANDAGIVTGIGDVSTRFGGSFFVQDGVSWRTCIRKWKESGGTVVHLTMFGLNLPDVEEQLQKIERLMVVVGAEKVPGEVYELADYNVAITSQPHSEIASLAIFLDHIIGPDALTKEFSNASIRVIPTARGKCTKGP